MLEQGIREEGIRKEVRRKFPTELSDDGVIDSYMVFTRKQAPPVVEYETTVGDFVAKELETEANKMPASMREQAESLRRMAYTERANPRRTIRVREISC